MIINIFCDASVNTIKGIACGGCVICQQDEYDNISYLYRKGYIQNPATNNSSEILAIWLGVVEALNIRRTLYPNAIFRLFSDSKISLYGLRDWIKNWINHIDDNGILYSSSGDPVKNQQFFIDIFNLIVETGLMIEFYHQRGHVKEGRVSFEKSRSSFIKANKVPPEALRLRMEFINDLNDEVDHYTRDALNTYISNGKLLNGIEVFGGFPFTYYIRSNNIHQYIHLINKSSVEDKTRHDFKGGYNQ